MSNVDDDYPALDGIGQHLGHPVVLSAGRIAGAKGLQHQPAQPLEPQHGVDHLRLDAREDAQAGDVRRVQVRADAEVLDAGRLAHQMPGDVRLRRARRRQRRRIRARKRRKVAGGHFGRAVAAEQLAGEVQADLGHHEVAGDDEGAQQVVRGVVLQLQHRRLAARQDDRLAQVLQHEAQRRAGVRQAVRPMQHHEGVEQRVVPGDGARDLRPSAGVDGAGVEQLVELEHGVAHPRVVAAQRRPQRPMGDSLARAVDGHLEVARLAAVVEGRRRLEDGLAEAARWDEAGGRRAHADGAAGHDDEHAGLWPEAVFLQLVHCMLMLSGYIRGCGYLVEAGVACRRSS